MKPFVVSKLNKSDVAVRSLPVYVIGVSLGGCMIASLVHSSTFNAPIPTFIRPGILPGTYSKSNVK